MKNLDEKTLSSKLVFEGRFLKIRQDVAELPNGVQAGREYVVHPGAAAMIPIAEDGRILIERQYRYSMRRTYVELPAGKLDPGEDSLTTAKRELLEETGYVAARWAKLTQIHPAIGFSDELMDIFLARELTLREAALDEEELLEIEWVTIGWMMDELRAGRLPDVKTQIATFWLEKLFSGAWPWPEFSPA